jgi:prepilin-type N-terminal cleavage/methylation domain-containing protein
MKKGFTITELVIVMGLLTILFSLGSVTLLNSYRKPVQQSITNILTSDLRAQETKAMTDDAYYGIYFGTSSYTLFKGASYNEASASNFIVNLDEGYQFTTVTFPGSQIVFSPISGEVANWVAGTDTLSIKDSSNSIVGSLKINKYGATY